MKKIRLQVITPERTVFDEDVDEVTLPTTSGEIGVLPNHVPLMSIIKPGEVKIKKDSQIIYLATYGGCIEVHSNGIRVLADAADHADEIDELKVLEAKKQAEMAMREAKDDVAFADAAAIIERNLIQLKIVKKKRHHG